MSDPKKELTEKELEKIAGGRPSYSSSSTSIKRPANVSTSSSSSSSYVVHNWSSSSSSTFRAP